MSIVEMRVDIDCPGCERKIKKALSQLDGVDTIDIDVDMQKVTVTGWVDQEKVLKTVRKTGKNPELWPFPYNSDYDKFNYHYGQYNTTPANNYYSKSQYNATPTNNYYSEQNSGYNSSISYFSNEQSSTYNYRKHSYNGHEYGYYQQPPSPTYLGERTSNMFSDENATGCTIM